VQDWIIGMVMEGSHMKCRSLNMVAYSLHTEWCRKIVSISVAYSSCDFWVLIVALSSILVPFLTIQHRNPVSQAVVLCQVERAKEAMLNQLYSSIRYMSFGSG